MELAQFEKDEYGKDILLGPTNNQMMMEWEKTYMEACIKKLNPCGDVLEIGFGLGYSATEIQNHNIDSHTIVEIDAKVYKEALNWSKNHSKNIEIINGEWPHGFDRSKKYDSFFYDPCLYSVPEESIEYGSCTNVFFLMDSIKNLSKKRAKFSFFCVMFEGEIQEYIERIEKYISTLNVRYHIAFEEYTECSVPPNCDYALNKKIYIPYVEILKP